MNYLIPVIFFIISLSSCTGGANKEHLAEVAKLAVMLDSMESKMHTMDTAKAGNITRIVYGNIKFIHEHKKDTMDKETAMFIADYSAIRKSYDRFISSYRDHYNELVRSKAQINFLQSDLKNNLVREEEFRQYLSSESMAVNKLHESIGNLQQWYETTMRTFEERNPKIEEMVKEMGKN